MADLSAAEYSSAPILRRGEVIHNEQVVARGLITKLRRPSGSYPPAAAPQLIDRDGGADVVPRRGWTRPDVGIWLVGR